MTDTPKHSVSVAGIVVDSAGRVLIIQRRDNGYWEPPGGVLNLDEAPQRGVEREVLEESGVVVTAERLTGVYKNTKRGIVALVFLCKFVSGTASPTDESRSSYWATLREVEEMLAATYSMRVLDAFSGRVWVRTHDEVDITSAV